MCCVGRGAGLREWGQRWSAGEEDSVHLSHSHPHRQNYVLSSQTDRSWKAFFTSTVSLLPFGWISCNSYWKHSNRQHVGVLNTSVTSQLNWHSSVELRILRLVYLHYPNLLDYGPEISELPFSHMVINHNSLELEWTWLLILFNALIFAQKGAEI